jgi:hypothetical protein
MLAAAAVDFIIQQIFLHLLVELGEEVLVVADRQIHHQTEFRAHQVLVAVVAAEIVELLVLAATVVPVS